MNETEADTRANRIDPVLRDAGWGVAEGSRVNREMICPGRITGGGGRANPLSADYVLSYRDRKLAVIEAKRAGLGHTAGVGQAKDYAGRLQARFAYATNGLGWYGIDMQTGAEGVSGCHFPRRRSCGSAASPKAMTGVTVSARCRSRPRAASGTRAITSTMRLLPCWTPSPRASSASC